ncbi:2OG-Fe dioxygenase family protein [Vibrio sp. EA2]|uniref:2OG-Fe dioxygenase family protein n=1 Tax=Vibrio sp. EA2 TaxID=3079860 RepID=UPI00294A26DF|nr:2OG-Fe dioxygenase family protein [Vibrio sp. EA2]MDV6252598.1 2OG-Fe dioxygenase family protein [Vibrio sp. EA2]
MPLSEWEWFCKSWEELVLDEYMNDNGKYRYRKHAVLISEKYTNNIVQLFDIPHYQSKYYNTLNGDVERWYTPISQDIVNSRVFGKFIEHALQVFNLCEINHMDPNWSNWYIEVHQFRIFSKEKSEGKPTPEGIHKDGVSYIFMIPIKRFNVGGGISTIYDNDMKDIFSTTMQVGDIVYVDESRVYHGVSPIYSQIDKNGIRDMLVITFKKEI